MSAVTGMVASPLITAMQGSRVPERHLLTDGGIVLGVDPGQYTGLVMVKVAPSLELQRVEWLASRVISRGENQALTAAELDARFMDRILEWARPFAVQHVAMEEPADASVGWRGQSKQQTGTAFRLGAYYGLAVGALWRHPTVGFISSYPVTNYGKRQGWMRGQRRERILAVIDQTLRAIKAPLEELSEHERMAFGIVMHHLELVREARFEAKVKAVKARASSTEMVPRRRAAGTTSKSGKTARRGRSR